MGGSFFDTDDTVAALATPPGRGGIAIVRVSGSKAEALFRELFRRPGGGAPAESHRLYYGHLYDGERLIDECMAVFMRAPHTYTREDVAEFHVHGGEQTAQSVLRALFARGVRPAEAGEFTKRAFLNGRVDLSQAEAVMSLIAAQGEQAARAALRQLSGGASAFIRKAQDELTNMLAGVAAAIDYPDETDEDGVVSDIALRADALADTLERACDERAARLLENGLDVVLCGRPNVGKSSLLNVLLGEDRAIVTDIPGTTRDIVRGSLYTDGLRINLSDTAGLRESGETVERIGVDRAREALRAADLALAVLDASRLPDDTDREILDGIRDRPHIVVLNKCDLAQSADLNAFRAISPSFLSVSAVTGKGLPALRSALREFAGEPAEGPLTCARHMRLAREAAKRLREAAEALRSGAPVDVAAVDLHGALDALGGVTGDQVDEKLLDSVFSQFCVGK